MRVASALLLPCVLLTVACSAPPQKEIDLAQGAIDAARAAGAEQYAAAELTAATSALQQAHDAVGQRDYRLALSHAVDAHERAQDAARAAAEGKARARGQAEVSIVAASTALTALQARVKEAEAARLPRQDVAAARRTLAAAEKTLQEARAALRASEYERARAGTADLPARITAEIASLDAVAAKKPARAGRRPR